ncbi:hypothetical protein BO85DRAFT_498325 [Aspergillus piperis CBS 112811]|uniref:BTB domain-containing protein n=1 Tax=Aspergillus piperis CBS 112811 TaxID=1448313 RepID=A0A8G1QXW2_9EURO|nr:hypothetical protein BO85DRAFT_498325 [Aspergillus piperis CBS 112811]RAH55918.1 hypothetical protein BO85DRAFT_498325 [Aspergillus piperis CBS 112811]
MGKRLSSVFNTRIIKFEVGPSRKEFLLHSGLFRDKAGSWGLEECGDSTSSGHDMVNISEPVEDIFKFVCEYLYTGDYQIFQPRHFVQIPRRRSSLLEGRGISLKDNYFENSASVERASHYFIRRLRSKPDHPLSISWADYSDVLLQHARLHHFAGQRGLEELSDISLYRLLHVLHEFPLHERRVGHVLQLLRLVFQNTPEMSEDIEKLMVDFTTAHIKGLVEVEEFQLLLDELPSLSRRILFNLATLSALEVDSRRGD